MKRLKEQIAEFNKEKAKQMPKDIIDIMDSVTLDLKSLGLEAKSLKAGDKVPEFSMPDHNGITRSISDYLDESTIVLSFYRGGW